MQVDAIIRTDVTWICWPLVFEAIEPELLADPPLGVVLPLVVLPLVLAPEPDAPVVLVDPVDPDALADASVPVTSTWCPLCCESSDSRPSRI